MAEMLERTRSSEITEWFEFLKLDDKRERALTADAIVLAFDGGDE